MLLRHGFHCTNYENQLTNKAPFMTYFALQHGDCAPAGKALRNNGGLFINLLVGLKGFEFSDKFNANSIPSKTAYTY